MKLKIYVSNLLKTIYDISLKSSGVTEI